MKKNLYPEWVMRHKTKGTAVEKRGETYYLTRIHSVWDKERRISKKITDEYLGIITESGLLPPKHKRTLKIERVTIKEFGGTVLINHITEELQTKLEAIYPNEWKTIFSIVAIRFFHNSPMKNMKHHYIHSYLSDLFADLDLNPKAVSNTIQKLGSDREKMVLFMRELVGQSSENLIIDLTHIFSESENINWLSIGHNPQDQFHHQINMLLIFSHDKMKPVYFRLLPGSIRDVSSIKATIEESKISNALFVGDKGFHSSMNVETLEKENLRYILPIKRNNGDTNYEVIKKHDRKNFDGFFIFEHRYIWHKQLKSDDTRKFILFFDEQLKTEEENSFLQRINRISEDKKEEKEQILNSFYERQFELGTITVVTNTKHPAEDIYKYLKARINVEVAFDTFKNILEADKTYMRTDAHMYGWVFVNFISLNLYYSLYGILASKEKLLEHYSPKDVIMHFSKVYKVNVDGKELIAEVPKTTRILLEKIGLPNDLLRPITKKPQS